MTHETRQYHVAGPGIGGDRFPETYHPRTSEQHPHVRRNAHEKRAQATVLDAFRLWAPKVTDTGTPGPPRNTANISILISLFPHPSLHWIFERSKSVDCSIRHFGR
jgi:hypothetical protein